MITDDPQICADCGRTRWTGDRFCGSCGFRFEREAGAAAVPLVDLGDSEVDGPDVVAHTEADAPSRRVPLGLLGAALGVLVIFGSLIAFTRSDTSSEAAPAVTPIPTPEAPTPAPPTPDPPTPDPPTPTPEPTVEVSLIEAVPLRGENPEHGFVSADLIDVTSGAAIAELGLGTGWLATVSNGGVAKAVNLVSGEVVSLENRRVDTYGSILTPDGIYSPSAASVIDQPPGAQFEQLWEFVPWDGSTPVPIDLPGFPVHAYIDEAVGAVAIVSSTGPEGTIADLIAVALRTGEQQRIEVNVDLWLMQLGFRFAPLLQRSGSGFMIEVGPSIYRWSWAEHWVEVTTGRVAAVSGDNVIVSRCTGPADCELVVVGADGSDAAVLDEGLGAILTNVVAISPDGSRISQATGGINLGEDTPSVVTIIEVESGASRTVPTLTPAWAATWSPNADYLILSGAGTVTALNVETGAEVPLGFVRRPTGTTPIVFLSDVLLKDVLLGE